MVNSRLIVFEVRPHDIRKVKRGQFDLVHWNSAHDFIVYVWQGEVVPGEVFFFTSDRIDAILIPANDQVLQLWGLEHFLCSADLPLGYRWPVAKLIVVRMSKDSLVQSCKAH